MEDKVGALPKNPIPPIKRVFACAVVLVVPVLAVVLFPELTAVTSNAAKDNNPEYSITTAADLKFA